MSVPVFATHAVIRAALPEESADIYSFYQAKRDRNVLPRPEADLKQSAEKGLFFIATKSSEIVAVAGAFDLEYSPYVELGGTFVESSLRGFGLQRLLFQLRIAATVINQGPEVRLLTAIDPMNKHSVNNALKSGFISWEEPTPVMFESCEGCHKRDLAKLSNRRCCCDVFILPDKSVEAELKEFLARTEGSLSLRRARDNDILAVTIESRLLKPAYRLALTEFASGKRW
ncbi:MAG TPA: hypothetical protein VGW39_14865 [Chthoniobacterales bacterium]|nr:hypothetical protein [Chthoniobacterales bacterium]